MCASAAGLRPGLFCWLCAARRARVIGRLSAAASRPRPRPTRAWGAASGGLGAALAPWAWACWWQWRRLGPAPFPTKRFGSWLCRVSSAPPGPGLWRSFRAGQRVGCPPWFMPWLSPLPGWFFWLRALPSFGFPGPLPRPAPLLRSSGFSRRAFGRQVGAGAQARKGGWLRRPTNHAALPSPALCSPRRTRPKEAGQDPGGSRERMPPGLPSGPVGLALPGRLTVQKK